MSWYYAVEDRKEGPVPLSEFRELVFSGVVRDDMLVWTSGMPEWLPLAQVRDKLGPAETANTEGSRSWSLKTPAPESTVPCPTCGTQVEPQDLARIGDTQICPSCKDEYVQRLREGAPVGGSENWHYAGFWIRFAALFIDQICIAAIQMAIGFVLGLLIGISGGGEAALSVISSIIGFGAGVAYFTLLHGNPRFQATIGKHLLGIRVIREDGGDVGYLHALGRFFGTFLSALPLLIGYIMAAFDPEKRSLHDRICDTRVVYKRSVNN